MGPLKVRWSYFPQALPWLFRFVTSTARRNVEKTADALISLLSQTFDAHGPLAQHANCSDIIRKTGYVVVYDTDQAYRKDALAWKLRRDRGVFALRSTRPASQNWCPHWRATSSAAFICQSRVT
jgi:D-amino-acid dehydrogenase